MATTDLREEALAKASLDWQNESAMVLLPGSIDMRRPLVDERAGLYVAYYHGLNHDDNGKFCDLYNQEVQRLIALHGIPSWAPVKRRPDRWAVLEMLAGHFPMALYNPDSPGERSAVSVMTRSWKSEPVAWARDRERKILLFAGEDNPRCGRADVIDLAGNRWMASYEYRRRHYPHLPWDNIELKDG